ncbi:crotonase/enoyl-CoA hydratase family protein [Chloracidobacterium sp. MS 40/45]|uniref:crotonase/enoyl-CoA hydratase family protein n=1 Tax=Chloracidobacterium aggregatum TaxID=2851959 RepID=UPI001B8D4095|nr:crotonase/enoyl-CoA hydratase family protein [Chloracidobacterium aggregatum]QUV99085.1 crotonase/enoyl-CoA hydratase family protein [Chloracidobacterium sp. MS 40/45]
METVTYEVQAGIAVITLRRPEVRNAVDDPTAAALDAAFHRFAADDACAVAVLTGAGGHFCAGADLKAVAAGARVNLRETGLAPMGPTRRRLPKPVIAAVEGYAVAGGLELALWCDLRVAAQTAVFGVFCRRFGVPLVDGGTVRLPRLIGFGRAMDLILTGRPVAAEEALAIGLVNRLCPEGKAVETALALARSIAAFPQTCLRSDRQSLYEQAGLDWEPALRNEFRRGMDVLATGETQAGAQRFAGGAGRHGAFEDGALE